jgi:hypothetical protein
LASIAFALTSEAFRLRLLGEPAAGWFVARYRLETEGLQLAPGESVPLAVELENQGKASWRAAHGMALGQRWFDLGTDELRGGLATTLPSDVEPGHRLKLVVPLTAPGVPGRYRVLLDLTHDNRRWLSEAGIAPGSVDVLVGTTQEADVPPSSAGSPQAVLPSYRQPDRAEYSGWALAMWRERPWTGVGSGNFRWLHRRYAGRHVDSVSAGSAFLELGATTGWLGVLTFCGTLAACFASLIAALRGLRPNLDEAGWPPLLLGLLVAVVVHGCVDYFLAATGHYLFFGFLVASTAVAGGRPAPGDAAASGSGRS